MARSAREPLICPRCQHELAPFTAAVPSDVGIPLESFDHGSFSTADAADQDLAAPRDWFQQEPIRQRLREIDRILHSPYAEASASSIAPAVQRSWPELPSPPLSPIAMLPSAVPSRSIARRAAAEQPSGTTRTKTSWLLSILLCVGVVAFGAGLGLLASSTAFQLPDLWRPGMTLTIGAEGLLILSLTWMAARLWRNSRRVNRQLHGVDQQLAEIEQFTGSLAGQQLASSQHYYHHFSQVASPHLLIANLQGQVNQLATRFAVE